MLNVVKNKNVNLQHGFTIVELLVVMVIIGILATISVVAYNGVTKRAKQSAVEAEAAQLRKKLALYNAENGDYPAEDEFNPDGDPDCGIDGSFCFDGQYPINYGCEASGTCSYEIWTGDSDGDGECDTEDCGIGVGGQVGGEVVDLTGPTDCTTGFIPVPGSAKYNQKGFCVMKYEAKKVGDEAVSQPQQAPWGGITQDQAISYSTAACSGCHLITESEWMTIADNIIGVANNWSDSSIGSGFIYRGNVYNTPSGSIGADYSGSYNGEKRALKLSNGEEIWDFSGNAAEWTQGVIASSQQPGLATDPVSGIPENIYLKEWNNPNLILDGLPITSSTPSAAKTWNSSSGIGKLMSNYNSSAVDTRGYVRGGFNGMMTSAGIYALLFSPQNNSLSIYGFRVAK